MVVRRSRRGRTIRRSRKYGAKSRRYRKRSYATRAKRPGRRAVSTKKRRYVYSRRSARGGKRSVGLAKKLASIMNAPKSYTRECFAACNLVHSRKLYVDLATAGTTTDSEPYSTGTVGTIGTPANLDSANLSYRPFGSVTNLRSMAAYLFNNSTTAVGYDETFWLLKWTRYYEVTNLTNVPIYCRLHKIYLKEDSPFDAIMSHVVSVWQQYVTNNGAQNRIVNSSGTLVDQDISDIMQPAVEPFIYTSPQDGAGGVDPFMMDQFEVLSSVFKHPTLRRALKKHMTVKSSKEFTLGPQQQVAFKLQKKKPYLFDAQQHVIALTQGTRRTDGRGSTSGFAPTQTQMLAWKGLTCTVILEVVGMTSVSQTPFTSTLNVPLPAAGGNFSWAWRDSVKLAPRLSKTSTYVKDRSSYLAVALDPATLAAKWIHGNSTSGINGTNLPTNAVSAVFGGANNQAAPVYS